MSNWTIEVVEREGFWGPTYRALIYEGPSQNYRGGVSGRTPQKAEANARKRIAEIKAERKRKAEVEYTVEFED